MWSADGQPSLGRTTAQKAAALLNAQAAMFARPNGKGNPRLDMIKRANSLSNGKPDARKTAEVTRSSGEAERKIPDAKSEELSLSQATVFAQVSTAKCHSKPKSKVAKEVQATPVASPQRTAAVAPTPAAKSPRKPKRKLYRVAKELHALADSPRLGQYSETLRAIANEYDARVQSDPEFKGDNGSTNGLANQVRQCLGQIIFDLFPKDREMMKRVDGVLTRINEVIVVESGIFPITIPAVLLNEDNDTSFVRDLIAEVRSAKRGPIGINPDLHPKAKGKKLKMSNPHSGANQTKNGKAKKKTKAKAKVMLKGKAISKTEGKREAPSNRAKDLKMAKAKAAAEKKTELVTAKNVSMDGDVISLDSHTQRMLCWLLSQMQLSDVAHAAPLPTCAAWKGKIANSMQGLLVNYLRKLVEYVRNSMGSTSSDLAVSFTANAMDMLRDQKFSDLKDAVESTFLSYSPPNHPADKGASVAEHKEAVYSILAQFVLDSRRTAHWKLPPSIIRNTEPYLQGEWQKEAYEAKPYVTIDEYEPTGGSDDEAVVHEKLKSSKRGGCDGSMCTASGSTKIEKVDAGRIVTTHPCLARHTECDGTCACHTSLEASKQCHNRSIGKGEELVHGKDILEQDVWGMDCYTRRNIEDAIFESGKLVFEAAAAADSGAGQGVSPTKRTDAGTQVMEKVIRFVDRKLIPAIQAQGKNQWDIREALSELILGANRSIGRMAFGQEIEACKFLQARVNEVGLNYFRIHPKGRGVVCKRKEGIAPGTLVSRYIGETYLPYRWFELQDAIKTMGAEELNDFYNIIMERPRDDVDGYDILFVDAAHKGAIASRMSHSCDPNCEAVVVTAKGKLAIALYTSKPVFYGEELTFDYACITESKKEFQNAICLCGTNRCRGSYLSFADGRGYQQIIYRHHSILHRNALILRAGTEELTKEDYAKLKKYSFGMSLLGQEAIPPSERGPKPKQANSDVPRWLVKWVCLVLEFIEVEEKLLPSALIEERKGDVKAPPLSEQDARLEAIGVREQRIQNLAISISKLKHVLGQPNQCSKPPLRFISEKESIEFLWTDPNSVLQRFKRQLIPKGVLTKTKKSEDVSRHEAELLTLFNSLETIKPTSVKEVQGYFMQMSETFRNWDDQGNRRKLTAPADLMRMYAHTEHYFVNERYSGFHSSSVVKKKHLIYNSMYDNISFRKYFKKDMKDDDVIPYPGKHYGAQFVWGQLLFWYKQTINKPDASLSADQRGSIALPDVESFFNKAAKYVSSERKPLIERLSARPDMLWGTGSIWTFKTRNVFGSPWLDAAFRAGHGRITPEDTKIKEIFSDCCPALPHRI